LPQSIVIAGVAKWLGGALHRSSPSSILRFFGRISVLVIRKRQRPKG
jgi:hypothetical protein